MVGKCAGSSGDEMTVDSGSQSCDVEHRRTQVRNCDSDVPKEVHMFVRRGSRFLSICLFGLSSV
jgi:hypothetical protein